MDDETKVRIDNQVALVDCKDLKLADGSPIDWCDLINLKIEAQQSRYIHPPMTFVENMLPSEETVLRQALNGKRRGQNFVKIAPEIVVQLLHTISVERTYRRELAECLARNSHKNCGCVACQDVRRTFERLGLNVEQK